MMVYTLGTEKREREREGGREGGERERERERGGGSQIFRKIILFISYMYLLSKDLYSLPYSKLILAGNYFLGRTIDEPPESGVINSEKLRNIYMYH